MNTLGLSKYEIALNTLQSVIKGIPYVGGFLDHYIFGQLAEIRMKRIEQILIELSKAIDQMNINIEEHVNENFTCLLEEVLPKASKSQSKIKQEAYKNLLINGFIISQDDSKMEEARICLGLINDIEEPGLYILREVSFFYKANKTKSLILEFDDLKSNLITFNKRTEEIEAYQIVPYSSIVSQDWADKLVVMGLIDFVYPSRLVEDGRTSGPIKLTSKGAFLINWLIIH